MTYYYLLFIIQYFMLCMNISTRVLIVVPVGVSVLVFVVLSLVLAAEMEPLVVKLL